MSFDVNEYYSRMDGGEILMAYKGNISSELISNVLEVVESRMDNYSEDSRIRKKVYNVLVESLQNLYHHIEALPERMQNEYDEKFGILVVSKVKDRYRISTGNFVTGERVEILKNKIDKINSMTREELKDMYKFILNHQRLSEKGGGGLGLVDIARKTGNKLDYRFEKFDDTYFFFNLDVYIDSLNE
ncbi:MAG: SiaB family protein kinase [Bacteroidales bacterium]|nr:SiaB family protein kinase [Bacteroidales bacterium]MBN2697223.1 SiaB family protein kinase [Bacteroidales bacterium]